MHECLTIICHLVTVKPKKKELATCQTGDRHRKPKASGSVRARRVRTPKTPGQEAIYTQKSQEGRQINAAGHAFAGFVELVVCLDSRRTLELFLACVRGCLLLIMSPPAGPGPSYCDEGSALELSKPCVDDILV